jgi:hypothetical protein
VVGGAPCLGHSSQAIGEAAESEKPPWSFLCFEFGEPERAGDQDDHAERERNGAGRRRQRHLERRQPSLSEKAAI